MSFNFIEIEKIKELVESFYKLDLTNKTRKREYVYARKVFYKICIDNGYTFASVGESIGFDHCSALHNYKSFHVVDERDAKIYQKCRDILNMTNDDDYEYVMSNKQTIKNVKNEYRVKELEKENKILRSKIESFEDAMPIIDEFYGWDASDRYDFIEYRLKPYAKLIQKKIIA